MTTGEFMVEGGLREMGGTGFCLCLVMHCKTETLGGI